jgi:hypothetical protein
MAERVVVHKVPARTECIGFVLLASAERQEFPVSVPKSLHAILSWCTRAECAQRFAQLNHFLVDVSDL